MLIDLSAKIPIRPFNKSIHYWRTNDKWLYWWATALRMLNKQFYEMSSNDQVMPMTLWRLCKRAGDNYWYLFKPMYIGDTLLQTGREFSRGKLINFIVECKCEIDKQTLINIKSMHDKLL